MQTNRTVPNNEMGIAIRDNEKGTRALKDVTISGDRNVFKKEAEKIIKCKDPTVEIKRMWNEKTKVIPSITVVTGKISKSFRKHIRNINGEPEIWELQKTAILSTAQKLWNSKWEITLHAP